MGAAERRQELLKVLCLRRHDTCENLAQEFGVTSRTIQHDIQILIGSYPIETVRGRHGGVRVADWYHFYNRRLNPAQIELLCRLRSMLEGEDLQILNSILSQFSS